MLVLTDVPSSKNIAFRGQFRKQNPQEQDRLEYWQGGGQQVRGEIPLAVLRHRSAQGHQAGQACPVLDELHAHQEGQGVCRHLVSVSGSDVRCFA